MKKIETVYDGLAEEYSDILDLYWGFELGPGWLEIMTKLLADIKKINRAKKFKIVQIKEKFGTLHVYTRHARKEILELIDEAEKVSLVTCETCGQPGTLRHTDWHHVACDGCEKKRSKT